MDTIMRRNNSISIVKKHAIPYAHLHKKTYFNALEKILISPKNLKKTTPMYPSGSSHNVGEAVVTGGGGVTTNEAELGSVTNSLLM